jgi:hypothetical protein
VLLGRFIDNVVMSLFSNTPLGAQTYAKCGGCALRWLTFSSRQAQSLPPDEEPPQAWDRARVLPPLAAAPLPPPARPEE